MSCRVSHVMSCFGDLIVEVYTEMLYYFLYAISCLCSNNCMHFVYCCYCSYLISVDMYAYELRCEEEFVNCFYPTVNKFLERDNKDLLYCIVLHVVAY